MSNTVNFKLDDDLYFELLALRVKLKAKGGWKGFIERVINDYKSGNVQAPVMAESIGIEQPEKAADVESKTPEKPQRNIFNVGEDEVARERARMFEKCATCGHDRSEHSADGKQCYGDGDNCECEGFVLRKL
jgi:hypothetical protein